MRLTHGFLLLIASGSAAAQTAKNSMGDEIALARTIVAKLDHATQNDPPPYFASEILVRVHKEATGMIEIADATSEQSRKGEPVDASSLFAIYSEFLDLYGQYELFVSSASKPLEVSKVLNEAMGKEYFEVKTYLEVATTVAIINQEDGLRVCKSSRTKRR